MIRGITWTHIQSVWNHSGSRSSPIPQTSNWSGTFCCFFYLIFMIQIKSSSSLSNYAKDSSTLSVNYTLVLYMIKFKEPNSKAGNTTRKLEIYLSKITISCVHMHLPSSQDLGITTIIP